VKEFQKGGDKVKAAQIKPNHILEKDKCRTKNQNAIEKEIKNVLSRQRMSAALNVLRTEKERQDWNNGGTDGEE